MRCAVCGEDKHPEEFPRNKNTRTGRHCNCKSCHNAQVRESRQRLYGGSRHYHLKRRYGIGAAEVDAMIKSQGGLCPVCRQSPAVHVDHNHVTKKVRGILCEPCNGGLGQFKDDPQRIRRAIDYLQRHESVEGELS